MTRADEVDIYLVGVLRDLIEARHRRRLGMTWTPPLRRAVATVARKVRKRDWRGLKTSFNGYLAEPTPWPEHMCRCGSGWTRRRALRSLRRHGYQP